MDILTKHSTLKKILYTGAGLVITTSVTFMVAMILYFILDRTGSATPDSGIPGTVIIVILHLLVLYAFREAIIVNKRNGHLSKAVYIVSGTGVLLMGLLFLYMALEFLGYHDYYLTTILLFLCSFCDIIAAVILLTAIFLQPES